MKPASVKKAAPTKVKPPKKAHRGEGGNHRPQGGGGEGDPPAPTSSGPEKLK